MKPGEQRHEPQPSSGMGRMVVVSAVLHVVVIVFILVATNRKDSESSLPLNSYSVELVGPGLLRPAGGGDSGVEAGPTPRPPEQKSLPPQPERKEPPTVEHLVEPAEERPEIQVKERPPSKPLQARKEVELSKPKEQPPSKAKETSKVVEAKSSPPELPAEKLKPSEPTKPKEAVKLPEKMRRTEPKPTKKAEDTPESEKVIKKAEKNLAKKEQPWTKNLLVEKSPLEKKPKETTQKSATSATRVKEQKTEEREEGAGREREQQILAAVEKIRADEEATKREKEIAAALERVRKGVTEKADRKGNEGVSIREVSGPSLQERQGNTERESGSGEGGHGTEFIAYTQRLKQRVKEAWILAERKPGLRAVVRFSVEPTGEVMEVELANSSGDRSFDQSALRAVRKASPFPSPPEAYREEFATQKVEITFSGEERIR